MQNISKMPMINVVNLNWYQKGIIFIFPTWHLAGMTKQLHVQFPTNLKIETSVKTYGINRKIQIQAK